MAKTIKDPASKIRLSETHTFAELVPTQWRETVGYCFVYRITLTHPKLPEALPYVYIGSKSLDKSGKWTHYQSSSVKVMRMLYMGFIPEYTIIEMVSPNRVKYVEDSYIIEQWKTSALRDQSLNFSLASKHTTRYKWVKSVLGEVDKRF